MTVGDGVGGSVEEARTVATASVGEAGGLISGRGGAGGLQGAGPVTDVRLAAAEKGLAVTVECRSHKDTVAILPDNRVTVVLSLLGFPSPQIPDSRSP